MKDKKSCDTCLKGIDNNCKRCHWQRNPRKWLSILPEKEGYYWFRMLNFKNEWVYDVCHITNEKQLLVRPLHSESYHPIEWLKNAEFQGPIRPEGE